MEFIFGCGNWNVPGKSIHNNIVIDIIIKGFADGTNSDLYYIMYGCLQNNVLY